VTDARLVIDGAHGEGGGQILRTSLALAALLGWSVQFTRIRAGRRNPGLAAQHLTAVRAAAALCAATLDGDTLNSQELFFAPAHQVRPGSYAFDVGVAIRDAFDAVQRQLQDHAREMRSDVKTHAPPTVGTIVRLLPDYGFLVTEAGDEIYLHRHAVLGRGFDKLNAGDKVRYVVHEGEGEQGAQASTVIPL
jgi:cold shock CspA family protein